MDILPDDLIGRQLRFTGQFDRVIPDVIRTVIHPDDYVLDIGANIGYVSCTTIHHEPSIHIAAIEPLVKCYSLLTTNLHRLSDDAIAINCAISNCDCKAELECVSGNTGMTHLARFSAEQFHNNESAGTTDVLSVPTLLSRIKWRRVDVVKIDVEGHEQKVIASLLSATDDDLPRSIVFEHHGRFSGEPEVMLESLRKRNYMVFAIRKSLMRWWLDTDFESELTSPAHDYVALSASTAEELSRFTRSGHKRPR